MEVGGAAKVLGSRIPRRKAVPQGLDERARHVVRSSRRPNRMGFKLYQLSTSPFLPHFSGVVFARPV
jgi:hypothetical protein